MYIVLNPVYRKRKFIERNDERHQLIQEKVARNAYTVLAFVIAGIFGYALTSYALSGEELSISLVVVSTVLLVIGATTYTLSRLLLERRM